MKRFFLFVLTLALLVAPFSFHAVAEEDITKFEYYDAERQVLYSVHDLSGVLYLCAKDATGKNISVVPDPLAIKELNGYIVVSSKTSETGWTTLIEWDGTDNFKFADYVVSNDTGFIDQIVHAFGIEGGVCAVANTSKGLVLSRGYLITELRKSDQRQVRHPEWQEVNLGKCNDFALLSDGCFYAYTEGVVFSLLDLTAEKMKATTYKLSKGTEVHAEETYVGFAQKDQLIYLTKDTGATPVVHKLQKGEEVDFATDRIGIRYGEYYRAVLTFGEGFQSVNQEEYERIFGQP